ncbi:MAG: hypothetical protein G01um10143_292 [Parcubacteria group bacterium Gr01-1014_3]|nr:MAG: hypothetical protein G01um10143_292 [Parcubacteria group bacterium Gr01-1014_3]
MRLAGFIAVFILIGSLATNALAVSQPTRLELLKNPQRTVKETLKSGISAYDFWKARPSLNTFTGFEKFFARQATHNPTVWRQGGDYTPQTVPRFYAVAGPPFDIHTPSGTIPGCLNLLCPPPQGALWVLGICWCSQ